MGLGSEGFMNPLRLYAKSWFCAYEQILGKEIIETFIRILESSVNFPPLDIKSYVTCYGRV